MTTIAEAVAPVPRPPHDPRTWLLDCRTGWRIGHVTDVEMSALDGAIALVPLPDGTRALIEPNGSFGGVTVPDHVALGPDGGIFLLDRATRTLKRFDPCCWRFDAVPCTLGFGESAGLTVACGNVYLCDPERHRVVVFSLRGFVLRAEWRPPGRAGLGQPFTPRDIAFLAGVGFFVSDPANGAIHVFEATGRWRRQLAGIGAVTSLAVDSAGRLYARIPGEPHVRVIDSESGQVVARPERADEIAGRFPTLPFVVTRDGIVLLCGSAFDTSGAMVPLPAGPPGPLYPTRGTIVTQAIDSALYRCVWDRIELEGCFPLHTRVRVRTFTAETEEPRAMIQALPEAAWSVGPVLDGASAERATWDAVVRSTPGRFLWVQLTLEGDGTTTPRLEHLRLVFPRISLRRYLPNVIGAEPIAADFTDRFLAVFDREFRAIEGQIDGQARLFDPLSAPTGNGNPRRDFLRWLGSWIGVSLDPSWPEARRRRFLKGSGALLGLRGTPEGLRRQLQLFLGLAPDAMCCTPLPPCGPCRLESPRPQQSPELILEHYRLRRWLFVGRGRLGEQAKLWGERIVNRSRLGGPARGDGTAQTGVSQLTTSQDPWRDPFHVYAHTFTVFLPARLAASAGARRGLERLIRTERPAHAAYGIVYVKPRFRIGVQSMIGFDSAVGCWPEGVNLDAASRLGRATVLGPGHDGSPTFAVGTEARVGATTRLT